MKQRREDRRHDYLYTKEEITQGNGVEKIFYVCRALNISDILASRVSILLNSNSFHDQKIGMPNGTVVVSVLVSGFKFF